VTFQAGLEHALAAKKLSPQSGTIHRIIGRIFEKLDRPREALDAYLEAVGLAPDDLVSRRRIVRLSLDFDDTRMARRHAQALLEHAADEPGSHFLAGLAASRDDDLEQARAHYEQAIELSPEPYAEAFYNIGLLERRAGRGEAAVAAYQEALRARPGYREAWNNLGLVLEDQGRTDEALQAFHRAIDLSDGYVAGRKNLAKCLSRMGRHAEAIEQLQALLRRTPGHRTSRLQLGVTLRRAGRAGEAVEVYRGLVREYPRYVRAWYNMGVALGALGHDDEARKAYQQALEHDPQHFASLKNLGLLESRHGLAAEARAHLSEALERAPADDEVRIKLAELHLGRGDYARCSVEARRVISQGARIDAARALLARCSSSQEGPGDVQ
jgi:tetratricopeptide (TPR) repeat protein